MHFTGTCWAVELIMFIKSIINYSFVVIVIIAIQ